MKILITGGAGFIGSNFAHFLVENQKGWDITILDKLTYAGKWRNLKGIENEIRFVQGDINDDDLVSELISQNEYIVNFAAETFVDRSIESDAPFIETNIKGTWNLLKNCKENNVKKFIQISTDEVYGSIREGSFTEEDALKPNNPYSASKAAADMLCRAYRVTHGVPTIIIRPSNNFGSRQHTEKLIPKLITRAMKGLSLPVYSDGSNVRDWIYVYDTCRGIYKVLMEARVGDIYNLGGSSELSNLEVGKMILDELGKPYSLIEFVKDRPGHDFRYSMDSSKIRKLGWKPVYSFREGLRETIDWYVNEEKQVI